MSRISWRAVLSGMVCPFRGCAGRSAGGAAGGREALVGGLSRHLEGLTDVDPGPVGLESTVDRVTLECRGAAAKGNDRGECFGGIIGRRNTDRFGHAINLG